MISNFYNVIDDLIRIEGGYVNDPNDSGGETKYGISKRSYPDLDIKNLSIYKTKNIYLKDFWMKYNLEQINNIKISKLIFFSVVNLNAHKVIRAVQKSLITLGEKIECDGFLGPKTVESINNNSSNILLVDSIKFNILSLYVLIVKENTKNAIYIGGWLNRINEI